MTDSPQHDAHETPEQVELERLKQKYRDFNKAIDRSREDLEEELNSGRYDDEAADARSAAFEESARQELQRIQQEIEGHARRHNLKIR